MTDVKTLLLTRPTAQSRALAIEIEAQYPGKTKCLISPLLRIEPSGRLPAITPFQTVIFTSTNGAQAFARESDARPKCICVGPRTAQTAKRLGFPTTSAEGTARELITLINTTLSPKNGPLLHIRGAHTTGDITDTLSAHGFNVQETVLYQQLPQPLNQQARGAFDAGEIDAVLLYSPRTAAIFTADLARHSEWDHRPFTSLCLSENIAKAVAKSHCGAILTAHAPSGSAMLTLIKRYLAIIK